MKKISFFSILIISFLFLSNSCEKSKSEDGYYEPALRIYKLKGDYLDKVCVGLTDDKSNIRVYPAADSNCGDPDEKPYKVKDDYYLDGCCNYGINSAYLTITKEEYQDIWQSLTKDSMMNLILDADPYVEYYIDEDRILLKNCTDCFVLDTALLNEIISNQELDKYFTKLK